MTSATSLVIAASRRNTASYVPKSFSQCWARRKCRAPWRKNLKAHYFLCPHCGTGRSPVDRDLGIEKKEHSPGVRRMEAFVGQENPFKNGREQLKILAGIEVTVKSVERTAEETGADIAAGQQQEIDNFRQLKLPLIVGKKNPFMYIEMDGTGINVVKKETEGRQGKIAGKPAHTRGART